MPQTSPAKAVHLLHNALVKDIGCPTISHERAYEKNAMSFQACKQTIKRTPSNHPQHVFLESALNSPTSKSAQRLVGGPRTKL